jgi:hypothetical protein
VWILYFERRDGKDEEHRVAFGKPRKTGELKNESFFIQKWENALGIAIYNYYSYYPGRYRRDDFPWQKELS